MSMINEQISRLKEKAVATAGVSRELLDAADTIEALSAKLAAANMERSSAYYNGGWIPCSERLPEMPISNPEFEGRPLELYLVTVMGGKYPFRAFWNGADFTDGWCRVDAIAWRPLPEPYKED